MDMSRISVNGYEPAHLSHSTVSSYRMCGKKFELTKVLHKEEKPGLAAIGGNAVHTATEGYDKGEWASASTDLDIIGRKFREAWDAEVEKRQRTSPSFSPDNYTATGRAAAKYGGKRNTQWWLEAGPGMVADWLAWRENTGWALPEIGGGLAVELDLLFELPGLDLPIKAYIDRVFVLPTGELAIVDLKTGRTPETAEQLGLYRVGLGLVHNLWPSWGYFWSPGGKDHGQPINLEAWTPERFSVMFNNAVNAINAGSFNPNPANACKNWCGVARYCAVVGGELAKGVDVLAN